MAARELPLEDRKPVTAEDLRALLRRKFPVDQFAMLYEVRDAAGFHANRSADVVMVGLWPSRGNQIEGMELKVTRHDWQRELSRPEKAEAFVKFCDRWWIVAANDDIVQDHELPMTWGLMVAGNRGLSVVTPAPRLKPKPIDRSFLAAMLKRACMTSLETPEVRAAVENAATAAREFAEANAKNSAGWEAHELERLREHIKKFEEASGVSLEEEWRLGRIGEAVRVVVDGDFERFRRDLHGLKGTARQIVERLTEILPDEVDDARPG